MEIDKLSNKSDHAKNSIQIQKLLPDVYESPISEAWYETTIDRTLSKDDTTHVSGYIGDRNTTAIQSRRITEVDPHIDAFQLEPVMAWSFGPTSNILTFDSSLTKLQALGTPLADAPVWGNVQQFNYAPPINIDMLINYTDYYWVTSDGSLPQYYTIENPCRKAQAKAEVFSASLQNKGSRTVITNIDVAENKISVPIDFDEMITVGFVIRTENNTWLNFNDRAFTVSEKSTTTTEVILTLEEPIASVGTTFPTQPINGDWFLNETTNQLHAFDGTQWNLISLLSGIGTIVDFSYQLTIYQSEATCICNAQLGWDRAPWDDNQASTTPWIEDFLENISFRTEQEWIDANGTPVESSQWYDIAADEIKIYSQLLGTWKTIVTQFKNIRPEYTGKNRWDQTLGCNIQSPNPWSSQNAWLHRTQLTTYTGSIRAQLPIIEFSAAILFADWTRLHKVWKYRNTTTSAFVEVPGRPARLELIPVKDFYFMQTNNAWVVYLGGPSDTSSLNVDYCDIFKSGFKFRVIDDNFNAFDLTVASSTFRQVTSTDPAYLSTDYEQQWITIVEIQDALYFGPIAGGTTDRIRIEPIETSLGDPWRGYQVHWVLTESTINTPIAPIDTSWIPSPQPSVVPTSIGEMIVGYDYQEVTITSAITDIELHSSLRYDPTNLVNRPASGTNDVRVYVNDVELIKTYEYVPILQDYPTDYVVVGNNAVDYTYLTSQRETVFGIQFVNTIPAQSIVRVEVGALSLEDNGLSNVPVRTIEDDNAFAEAAAIGNQPVFASLVEDVNTPQIKDAVNQTPYFSIYDVVTGEIKGISQIFTYVEDSSYPLNSNIQKRIKYDAAEANEWFFEQHLIDVTTGEMYAYHITSDTEFLWVNPLTQEIKKWFGTAYTDRIQKETSPGFSRIVDVTFGETRPQLPEDGDLWYNTKTEELFEFDTTWNIVTTDVRVTTANPLLRTFWRPGKNKEEYVPKLVNREAQTPTSAEIASGDVSWETFDQWYYNISHENRKELKYTQLFSHFSSILQAQAPVAGLIGGGRYTYAQEDINYGLGGTIKEHNDSYDTLISALLTHVSPITLIEFAQNQYKAAVNAVTTLTKVGFQQLEFTSTVEAGIASLVKNIVSSYESNNFNIRIYGDSTSEGSGDGMKHWIATLPNLGLSTLVEPYITQLEDSVEITFHDGHKLVVKYSQAELDKIYNAYAIAQNGRVASTNPPASITDWQQFFSAPEHAVWYNRAQRKLYILDIMSVAAVPPADAITTEGAYYYNTASDVLQRYVGGVWVNVGGIAGDVSPAIRQLNMENVVAATILEVERLLYLGCIGAPNRLKTFELAPSQAAEYDVEIYNRFLAYCLAEGVTDPFDNTLFNDVDAFTWNYMYSTPTTLPNANAYEAVGYWKFIYKQLYNTEYPHLEPWKLQGYELKPTWWDATYAGTARRWSTLMWTNIMNGFLPAGVPSPEWTVPTYAYVPVNYTSSPTSTGYQPDDLLPPYFAPEGTIRSVFTNYSSIQVPSANYAYGRGSAMEWQYENAKEFLYDKQIVYFLLQPMRYMHFAFGPEYVIVDDLNIDRETKQVASHSKVRFHGDIDTSTANYKVRGINQWYVNYNRHSGFDNSGEFETTWKSWTAKLGYQTSSIVDTSTLDVSSKFFDLTALDYSMKMYNTGIIDQKWADVLTVNVTTVPNLTPRYDNEEAWKFSVGTCYSQSRTLHYHPVKTNRLDIATDGALLLNKLQPIEQTSNTITLSRNWVSEFSGLNTLVVQDTNGTTTTVAVSSVVYNDVLKTTTLTTSTLASVVYSVDLPVEVTYEFEVGDMVNITSDSFMPNGVSRSQYYYICRDEFANLRLAQTYNDAMDGVYLYITATNKYKWTIGLIGSTFTVFNGQGATNALWTHYQLDTTRLITASTPMIVDGMQSFINFTDGFAEYTKSLGLVTGDGALAQYDEDTGRLISWKSEQERFIFWAYALRRTGVSIQDRYAVEVSNVADKTWAFTEPGVLANNTPIMVSTIGGALPTGVISGLVYYVTAVQADGTFKLAVIPNGTANDIVDPMDLGSGNLYLLLSPAVTVYPTYELNPMREAITIDNATGFIDNVVAKNAADIRLNQTVFDQYGRTLSIDKFHIIRRDKQTRLMMLEDVQNDLYNSLGDFQNTNTSLHFGGAKVQISKYQHVLVFNNYTITGAYIYDPYIGMNVNRFTVDFYRASVQTFRPNLGGYMLYNGAFVRNIEGTIADMSTYYSAYDQITQTKQSDLSKRLLDYEGEMDFLQRLSVTPSTYFTFYRGMLQSKGSSASITAYINSRRFIDAKVDEFWAWKVGEFGSSLPKQYPEFNLTAEDGTLDDIRWYFGDQMPVEYEKARFEEINLDEQNN